MHEELKINAFFLFILIVGFGIFGCVSKRDIVIDQKSGQKVLINQLVILSSGQDVESLVKEFNGKIVIKVKETGTYQVRFPVSNLNDLDIYIVAEKLRQKGLSATYVIIRNQPDPMGPQ